MKIYEGFILKIIYIVVELFKRLQITYRIYKISLSKINDDVMLTQMNIKEKKNRSGFDEWIQDCLINLYLSIAPYSLNKFESVTLLVTSVLGNFTE